MAFVFAIGAGCAHSDSAVNPTRLVGGNARGQFEVVVTAPRTLHAGTDVRLFRMEHRNVGGRLASYAFDVALDRAPSGCRVTNMMRWSDVQQSLRIGSWPGGGYNLRPETGAVDSVEDAPIPATCHGTLSFAVVAVPSGGSPIVKHIAIAVV